MAVVDDDPVVLAGCRRILEASGYEVFSFVDPQEAMERIPGLGVDLLLTDLVMPGIGGIELFTSIRERDPSVVSIVVTAFATVETAVQALKEGAADYVAKPYTPDQLRRAVAEAIKKRDFLSFHPDHPAPGPPGRIVGKGAAMSRVQSLLSRAAGTNGTVLIMGESGTGKELVARAIHERSARREERFVAVDCASLVPSLFESQLFGHLKGAFTGAHRTHRGFLEEAAGGTLFLDEIGELVLEVQAKLLRVLQGREFTPVGATMPVKTNVRIIAATNRDLKAMVYDETFREDLFYRIYVLPIYIPALRERREDIPDLVRFFVEKYATEEEKPIRGIDREALEGLQRSRWPGNVRQLQNAVHRAVVVAGEPILRSAHFAEASYPSTGPSSKELPVPTNVAALKSLKKKLRKKAVAEVERRFVLSALARSGRNVSRAAREVGLDRANFQALMRKHGVSRKLEGEK